MEINRLVCKTSSLIYPKYTAFPYVTTSLQRVIISRTEYSFLSKQSVMSVHTKACFLSLNRISELVWDNESYEAGAPSDSSSEDEGGFKEEPGVSHLQPDRPTSRCHASISSLSSYVSDEEEIFQRSKHHQLLGGHGPLDLTEV
jgi:hypothetical protein